MMKRFKPAKPTKKPGGWVLSETIATEIYWWLQPCFRTDSLVHMRSCQFECVKSVSLLLHSFELPTICHIDNHQNFLDFWITGEWEFNCESILGQTLLGTLQVQWVGVNYCFYGNSTLRYCHVVQYISTLCSLQCMLGIVIIHIAHAVWYDAVHCWNRESVGIRSRAVWNGNGLAAIHSIRKDSWGE